LEYNLDYDIRYGRTGVAIARERTDDEPLLINTPGSWEDRPTAETDVTNLFVAGDFTQTETNFASMEAANESARKAVNALIGYEACEVKRLQDPNVWWFRVPQQLARLADRAIYRTNLPLRSPYRLPILAWVVLGLANALVRAPLRLLGRKP
jgi:hypothetical protein